MKDLRKDFDYGSEPYKMSEGHTKKFKNRLEETFGKAPKQDYSIIYKMVAVAIIAVLSTVFVLSQDFMNSAENPQNQVVEAQKIGLGDISPELKTLEDYYLASIKVELATLETSEKYDDMINSYLEELQNINKAYDDLEKDLNTYGVTEEIINAMIDNLKLRLELLQDLKQKLNNLNQKQNENQNPVYQV
jgi:hypothetical protein